MTAAERKLDEIALADDSDDQDNDDHDDHAGPEQSRHSSPEISSVNNASPQAASPKLSPK